MGIFSNAITVGRVLLTGMVCLFVFAAMAAPPATAASETGTPNEKPVQAWIFPILGSPMTEIKFGYFIQAIENYAKISVKATYSNNTEQLFSRCRAQSIDFAVLSYNQRTIQLLDNCQYTIAARFDFPVNLYTTHNTRKDAIKTVGTIRGNHSHDVALQHYPRLAHHEFSNYPAAVVGLLRGEVDALIASPLVLLTVSQKVAEKITTMEIISKQGHGVFLLSDEFSKRPQSRAVKQFILENHSASRAVFVDTFGFGAWYVYDPGTDHNASTE